ncbi:hypothetical protein OIU78_028655 [Salix suchowensis]|nr:hypothetical protein OIU78_028655 [Salix suchowensis]
MVTRVVIRSILLPSIVLETDEGISVFGGNLCELSIHLVRLVPCCPRPALAVLRCLAGGLVVIFSRANPLWKQRDLTGVLEVQYFHDRASFTTAVALNQSPAIDVTATIGTPTIAFGAEAGYDTTLGSFTKYTAGISVTKPDSYASMILGDKGDSLQASYVHHLDLLKNSSVAGEITRRFSTNENTFTIGGSFPVDHLTVVKAKLNNHGKLGALVQHEVIPKSVLTISSEVDTKALDKSPRFGLAIALKP